MFLFKKIAGLFLSPLTICITLLVSGVLLLLFTRKQKTGKLIVTLGVVFLLSVSYGILSNRILGSLEHRYLQLQNINSMSDVRWIVVLGGGHITDPNLQLRSRLSGESLSRLIEGVTIHKRLPQSRMILSGGNIFDPVPESKVMADLAIELGLDKRDIVEESAALDTEDQARLIKKIVGEDKFILVTSAYHMPRSMAFFRKNGMDPVPAPTGHHIIKRHGISPFMFFPNSGNIEKTRIAVHEYIGLFWADIKGWI